MSIVVKTVYPDFDVALKNAVEYASVGLDSLYKLSNAAAVQLGKVYDQRRVREHRQAFGQQLETFASTLRDCYVFADNVEMLRDNLDTASAKEVRSIVEEMATAGERIHSMILRSITGLRQYSQASPYDIAWPATAKNAGSKAPPNGPALRAQFQSSLQGLLTSFNQISGFWNDQVLTLNAFLSGKDGKFGLTADQVITLATKWARYSPVITETVHSLVKICDALKIEPGRSQSSSSTQPRPLKPSATPASKAPETTRASTRRIEGSPSHLISDVSQPSLQHVPTIRGNPSLPNDRSVDTKRQAKQEYHTGPNLSPALKFTSFVFFAFALGPNLAMNQNEIKTGIAKYSSPPSTKRGRQNPPKSTTSAGNSTSVPQANSSATKRKSLFGR